MRIITYESPAAAGKAAALLFAAQLMRKPESVLGLATGSSPLPLYQELIRLYREGLIDFSRAVSFNLDEYIGIEADHPCSYHRFMRENLFDAVNMRPESIHIPDGMSDDPARSAKGYDEEIVRAGGIDIQLLGVGRNGHIGFNEPSPHFVDDCHVAELTASTIAANQRFFPSIDDVPKQALSLGIKAIMNARQVVLIASGHEKAHAIAAAVHGPVTPQVPVTVLRYHPNCLFLLDQAAASEI